MADNACVGTRLWVIAVVSNCLQGLAGKRKARSEEAEAPVKRGSVARKAVKRAAGLTPSRKGSSTQGTPLRVGAKAGPSRLAMATSAADLENMGRAANAASTPVAHVSEDAVVFRLCVWGDGCGSGTRHETLTV